MSRFTIGCAAKAATVNVETVRFYERKGLIEQPPTPAGGGAREYGRETVARIRFIRQAQEIGFSLREIAELLELRTDPKADCADVLNQAIAKRAEVQAKLEQLSRMQAALDELIASCPGGGDVKACTILDAMQREPGDASARFSTATYNKGKREMKTTTFSIEGMHCEGCARTIEALVSRVPGVRSAEVSLDERRARILHDQDTAPTIELTSAIAKGGFTAKATEK